MKTFAFLFVFALCVSFTAVAQDSCINGIPTCFGCNSPESCYQCHTPSYNEGDEWDVQTDWGWYCLCLCGSPPPRIDSAHIQKLVHSAPDFRKFPAGLNSIGESFRNTIRNVTGLDLLAFTGPSRLNKKADFLQVHMEAMKNADKECGQKTIRRIMASGYLDLKGMRTSR